MLAQYALGRRATALRTFERCRQVVSDELGVAPSQETRDLYAAILREEKSDALLPSRAAPAGVGGSAAVPARAPAVRPSVPLYGRSRELGEVTALVREALAGRFTVLLLDGAPGMGKTCFLEALVDRVWSLGFDTRIGSARGHLLKRPLPGAIAGDALGSALAGIDGIEKALDAAFSRDGAIPWLALDRLAMLLAAAGPVVLVFDDLHDADSVTLSVLAYLRHRLPEAPVAVVASAPVHRLSADHPLRTLTVDATVRLDVLRAQDVDHVSPALWAKTGGHPHLLSACLKATSTGEEWRSGLSDAVMARAREAGPECHKALVSAALFDRPFSAEELAAVTGRQPLELIDELEQMVEREILTMSGVRFAFRYEAVREILLLSMSEARRALLSEQIKARRPVNAIAPGHGVLSRVGG